MFSEQLFIETAIAKHIPSGFLLLNKAGFNLLNTGDCYNTEVALPPTEQYLYRKEKFFHLKFLNL